MVRYRYCTLVVRELRAGADLGHIFFRDGHRITRPCRARAGYECLSPRYFEEQSPFRVVASRERSFDALYRPLGVIEPRGAAQQLTRAALLFRTLNAYRRCVAIRVAALIHISEDSRAGAIGCG